MIDETGRRRKSITDALGRLAEVWETDPANQNTFLYQTVYGYDVLGNLLRVDQKGNDGNSANWRTRQFTYNSLSQLLTAANPESGTISYLYDSDGNVTRKTDARNIYLNYTYDALHRVTQKTSSDGSVPTTYFTYDAPPAGVSLALQNLVGRMSRAYTPTAQTFFSYDVMGRIVWQPTCSPSNCGATRDNITATYDLAGSLTSLTYPSTRKVTYGYDAAGRPLSAIDTTNGINYALNAQYAPHGALSSLSHVSTAAGGLLETRTYTPRLQPDLLQAGINGGAFFLNLDYNFTEPSTGKNNGNVYQVANLRNTNRTTDYTYDALNRIKTATTLGPDWGQLFAIDPWGNLTAQSVTKGTAPSFSATALASNRLSGYSYDAAGNMLGDGQHTYVYNAESQVASLDANTSTPTAYVYAAAGMRVRKTTGANWTEYLYFSLGGAGGADPVAERDQTGAWTEYVFFGGKRVARRESAGAVYYYFSDHLGSADVVTDSAGVIKEESDYFPYGGERVLTDLLPKQNYKFTGKERDTESGLDYFGARYYSSRMGRWLTPDWANGAEAVPYADFGDPQSLNLYGYVGNQPVTRFDADGHCCETRDVVDFGLGFLNARGSDNLAGAGRVEQKSAAGKIGAAFGDAVATIQGLHETILGAGGEVGGLVLDATGVGAVAGVPVQAVSTGLILHGVATGVTGGSNLLKAANDTGLPKPPSGKGSVPPEKRDPKRVSTSPEKDQKLAEQGGKCANCSKPVKPGDSVGHHVKRHADGGKTDSKNVPVVCKDCHKKLHSSSK